MTGPLVCGLRAVKPGRPGEEGGTDQDPTELLDALYYQLVLGAPNRETARANLDQLLADVIDLRDALDLYGFEAVVETIATTGRDQQLPA